MGIDVNHGDENKEPEKKEEPSKPMQWPGAIAFIAFLIAVCYCVTVVWG